MTLQDLYKTASTKLVLSDDEMKDNITSQDINSMTESAWTKCLQLLESDSIHKKSNKKTSSKRNEYMEQILRTNK